jgi:hypothetical protein
MIAGTPAVSRPFSIGVVATPNETKTGVVATPSNKRHGKHKAGYWKTYQRKCPHCKGVL